MKKQIIAFVADDCKSWRVIDKSLFLKFLSDFGSGTKLKLTIENYFPQRSLKQNGLLHYYLTELAEESGIEMEKFKELMKYKFLRRPLLNIKGEEIADEYGEIQMYVPSTIELDKAEMGIFIDSIRLCGIEFLGYVLAEPDENHKINFQEKIKDEIRNKL